MNLTKRVKHVWADIVKRVEGEKTPPPHTQKTKQKAKQQTKKPTKKPPTILAIRKKSFPSRSFQSSLNIKKSNIASV